MAQQKDWSVLSDNVSVTTVIPDPIQYGYDLFNLTDNECLVYGERYGDNINLRWGDPARSNNIRFQRQSGSNDPIKFEELIAFNVRGGSFVVYEHGRWGINLGWSKTPKFEWKIVGGNAGDVVGTGQPVGLFSIVENDLLMYESRDWGINLKWFKDSGKYSSFGSLISAGNVVKDIYRDFK